MARRQARDQYLRELQQFKNVGMTLQNADLAKAIDQEIARVGGTVAPDPSAAEPAQRPALTLTEAAKNNALQNGSFNDVDESGNLLGWSGVSRFAKPVIEHSEHYLRASVPMGAPEEQSICAQNIGVPKGARAMTAGIRMRVKEKGFNGPAIKAGIEIRVTSPEVPGQPTDLRLTGRWQAWTNMEQTITLPPDLTRLNVELRVLRLAGDFDFDDFVIKFK